MRTVPTPKEQTVPQRGRLPMQKGQDVSQTDSTHTQRANSRLRQVKPLTLRDLVRLPETLRTRREKTRSRPGITHMLREMQHVPGAHTATRRAQVHRPADYALMPREAPPYQAGGIHTRRGRGQEQPIYVNMSLGNTMYRTRHPPVFLRVARMLKSLVMVLPRMLALTPEPLTGAATRRWPDRLRLVPAPLMK